MHFPHFHQKIAELFHNHTSKNLAFRDLSRADSWPLLDATTHPEFNRFLLWDAPKDINCALVQVEKLIRQHQLFRCVAISIVERQSGTWKGMAVLKTFRDGIEMSLYIHPDAWNTGIVFSAGCAIIELLFQHFPNTVIYNRVIVGNRRMYKINVSYGFEPTDQVGDEHANGEPRVLDVFRLNVDKWKTFDGIAPY